MPALVGRKVFDTERSLFTLAVRLGGLGLCEPVECSEAENKSSQLITAYLKTVLY